MKEIKKIVKYLPLRQSQWDIYSCNFFLILKRILSES